jgi:hypothetical protein
LDALLGFWIEIVNLHRELAAHEIEQGLGVLQARLGCCAGQDRMALVPDVFRLTQIFQRQVCDLQQPTLSRNQADYADNELLSYFAWKMEVLWLSPQRTGGHD